MGSHIRIEYVGSDRIANVDIDATEHTLQTLISILPQCETRDYMILEFQRLKKRAVDDVRYKE